MKPLSIIKMAMFVILVPGAVYGDTGTDQEKDLEVLRSHAEKGNTKAQFKLGTVYDMDFKEWGVVQDYQEALKWYTKAAKKGYTDAQNNLGNIYREKKDYQGALKWYTKAAKKDNIVAQSNLGNMYFYMKDYQEALKWYTKAAENGNTDALRNLGFIYIREYGVQKNLKKGLRLVLLAAQQDHALAQYNLGTIMNNYEGYEEAYYWLNLAKKKEKDLEEFEVNIDSLNTLLYELEGLIDDHKKINNLQKLTGDHWRPKQSSYGGGSGFYIKEGLVLTNEHVIDSCDEVRAGDYYYRVDVIKKDPDVDLALLKISSDLPPEKYRPSARFRSESAIQLGEGVAVFGYPLQNDLSFEGNFTIGNVSSIEGRPTDITPSDSFQFTAPVQPGNSGGPVLDAAGNVVGIAANLKFKEYPIIVPKTYNDTTYNDTTYLNIAQNINFAVSLKAIRKFLKDAGVEPNSSSLDTRKKWTEIAKAAQKFTVPVLCFTDKP